MSKKSPIIVNPARPEVDIETSFKLRDRLEIRPRRAVDDLRKSGEIDPDQLARFAERTFTDGVLHIPGEQPGHLTGGIYRRHVGPVGDALARMRSVRAGHTTSVDDRSEAQA